MAKGSGRSDESSAIRTHLTILQGVIQRMAENSRSCKVWCVTLVAATLVLVARTGEPRHALIALAPTVLLYVLDAYYLMLERRFRNCYDDFVDKFSAGESVDQYLYRVEGNGSKVRILFWAMLQSFSVWPFYFAVVITILLAWLLIL